VSMLDTEKRMRDKGAKLVITEAYQDVKIAQKVAGDTGSRLVVIPAYADGTPGAESYPALMRTIARALVEAARG
jgi:hypothetical protein